MRFWELPATLLFATLAFAAPASIERREVLNPENFASTIAQGAWFIEHFSPYCGHCRAFAPSWEILANKADKNEFPGVKLAQIDCSVNGDLCDDHGIKGYPTMQMYRDGEMVEAFTGRRDVGRIEDLLHKYEYKDYVNPEPTLNPDGEVLELTPDTFSQTLALGPAFVKFYAPWCGHCRKLAPIWVKLAAHAKGKLTVAEVNCEKYGGLCGSQGIDGYPTLSYFVDGQKSDYHGSRKLEGLSAFADKATASPTKPTTPGGLEAIKAENEVVYVLVHKEEYVVKQMSPTLTPLLGSPAVFTVHNPPSSFYEYHQISEAPDWTFLAFKSGELVSSYSGQKGLEGLSTWVNVNRLPNALELTQDTFQEVMNAPHRPLVVIAAVPPSSSSTGAAVATQAGLKAKEFAKKWRLHRQVKSKSSSAVERDVIFAWMDGERWKDWLKSMYGIQGGMNADELEDVKVVITDHSQLVYWPLDKSGDRLKLTDSKDLFAALEDAMSGRLTALNSENAIERMARYLSGKMMMIQLGIVAHPYITGILFVSLMVGIIMLIRAVLSDDELYDPREYEREKERAGRLD